MKKIIFSGLLFTMLFTSCSESTEVAGETLTELAGSKEVTAAVNSIIEKAGFSSIDEVEFFEINSRFSESTIEGNDPSVSFDLTLVTKEDKDKLMSYNYDFATGTADDGQEVTLTSGSGSSQEIAAKYDDFKSSLFTSADIPPLSKMDDMKKAALESSGYEKDQQYTSSYSSDFSSLGRFRTHITVSNKKVSSMSKTIEFDLSGEVKK